MEPKELVRRTPLTFTASLTSFVAFLLLLFFTSLTRGGYPPIPDFIFHCNVNFGTGDCLYATSMFISPNLRRLFVMFGQPFPTIVRYDIPVNASFPNHPPHPSVAFGQPNTSFTPLNFSQSTISGNPNAIWVDKSGTLWATDTSNDRVLWWDNAETATVSGLNATGVLGQVNFTTTYLTTTEASLSGPMGIFREEGGGMDILWVADSGNYRLVLACFFFVRELIFSIKGCWV